MISKSQATLGCVAFFLLGMLLVWAVDFRMLVADLKTIEAGGRWSDEAALVPVSSDDAMWGIRTAPVTLVVFSDLECAHSAQLEPTLSQLQSIYGRDKLRVVWKNFPQPSHKFARHAAVAAETVRGLVGLDGFMKFRQLAFRQQTGLLPERIAQWAQLSGARPDAFRQAIEQNRFAEVVERDVLTGRQLGVSTTPTVFVNGIALTGAQSLDRFRSVIDGQLLEAKKLLAEGTRPTRLYVELTRLNQPEASKSSRTAPAGSSLHRPSRPQSAEDLTVWKVAVGDSPIRGNTRAPVTVVVFGDFECPHSRRARELFQQLEKQNGDNVRFVWKDRPLPYHPRAIAAAVFAREARRQKGDTGFWAAHDKLFENNTKLEPANLDRYAAELGLDVAKVKAALADERSVDAMQADLEAGDLLRANATPHVFVNGVRVLGVPPLEGYQKLIDTQLDKARALSRTGVAAEALYDRLQADATVPPPVPAPEVRTVPAPGKDNPSRGSANAKVVIQVFADFQCNHSRRANETLALVEQRYGDRVRIVWRHRPVPLHPAAPLASEAAQEVFAQKGNEAFWKYHALLFENQLAPGGLDRPALERYATQVGVDIARFKAALDNHTRKPAVDADQQIAEAARIVSTPTFLINGYYLAGAVQFHDFRKLIDRALREAK